ncbi:MAG: flagellar basal-body rod protein FlgF [Candidatus Scalinduaceae bacterium]
MIDSIYDVASGLDAFIKNQEVIARNIANANTVGFKKSVVDFSIILEEVNGVEKENIQAEIGINFSEGNLEYTGNSLDIAIDGEGFFTIETEQGLRYTRNGQFKLSDSGEIVTLSGGKLLGTGGTIFVPKSGGEITIDSKGIVKAGNTVIGELLITNFNQLSVLTPTGEGLFEVPLAAMQDLAEANFKIAQGYLERSNVNVALEMIDMIANMRSYEASSQIIKSLSESTEQLISNQLNSV